MNPLRTSRLAAASAAALLIAGVGLATPASAAPVHHGPSPSLRVFELPDGYDVGLEEICDTSYEEFTEEIPEDYLADFEDLNDVTFVLGSPDDDSLFGGSGSQIIIGFGGEDSIGGGSGSDYICGGRGDDLISAGSGSDEVFGGRGSDEIWGGSGRDALYGERGADSLHGNSGADYLNGGPGFDDLDGGSGADTLVD